MADIYVYSKDALDTGTTGLVGSLIPISCEHEEIGNGMSSVTLVHPFDEWGKWEALQNGNILSVPVRARTTPEIDSSGSFVTRIQKYTVKEGLDKEQRQVYTTIKSNKKKGKLTCGREVIVLQVGTEQHNRYKVKYDTYKKLKKLNDSTYRVIYTWNTGWVDPESLELSETNVDVASIEAICPSGNSRAQLFRIQSVEKDVKNRQITVYAVHISYDLSSILTVYKNDEPLDAVTALNGIMEHIENPVINGVEQEHDFAAYTNSANTCTSCDWRDASVTSALLDPDTGFAQRWNTELIRDDNELYFLANGGTNRGIRIEHGKNLTGATLEVNWEDLVTIIKPRGVTKKGNPLYLSNDCDDFEDYTTNPENYVVSPNAALYGARVKAIDCDDCTVEKGDKAVNIANARTRMRAQALAMFTDPNNPGEDTTDKADQPKITMTVNFAELGQTVEYEKYRPLENVYLWDRVVVAAPSYGVEVTAKVTKTTLDVLTNRLTEIELGNVKHSDKIYSWQLPSINFDSLSPFAKDLETPVVNISGTSFQVPADQNGVCQAVSATYLITSWAGYKAINPVIGSITGVPEGMTVTEGEIGQTGTLPITISVADGATLGGDDICLGQIDFNMSKPIETVLSVNWVKVCNGENGEDGSIRQFVFKVMSKADYDALNGSSPAIDQEANEIEEYIPNGWSDNPNSISEAYPYEWMSYRDRIGGEWGGFCNPTLWSHWGAQGRDGDGVEYIYKRTDSASAPSLPNYDVNSAEYQNDDSEYLPSAFSSANWNDDPLGVNSTYKYEWVAVRKKKNGVWGAFSSPALWAKYGEKGETGPAGQDGTNGTNGTNGIDGVNGSKVYYESYTPTGTNFNAGDVWYVTSGAYVGNVYNFNGSSWVQISYDYEALAIRNLITDNIKSRIVTSQTVNAVDITARRLAIDGVVTIDAGSHSFNGETLIGIAFKTGSSQNLTTQAVMGHTGGHLQIVTASSGVYIGSASSLYAHLSVGASVAGGKRTKAIITNGYILPETHGEIDIGGTNDTVGAPMRFRDIYLTSSAVNGSDRAFKRNISNLNTQGLLRRLRPRRYRLKINPERIRFGFVAQEAREAITGTDYEDAQLVLGEDGDMSIAYTELIAPLVEGWQEHERRIDALEGENRELRGRLDRLEKRLKPIKSDGRKSN